MRKNLHRNLIFLTLLLLCLHIVKGQNAPDHQKLIEQLNNSNHLFYLDCIKKYDSCLNRYPDDIGILIEKCRFIENAQYDDMEDINPNQDELDSCLSLLNTRFPDHPDVLLYQAEFLWQDELLKVVRRAETSIENHPGDWSDIDRAELYKRMATYYYYADDFDSALLYSEKAIYNQDEYKSSLEYARLLIKLNRKDEALEALKSDGDTIEEAWHLSQKAALLLELEAYQEAYELYTIVAQKDSSYINNNKLAKTLDGAGEYDLARTYLVADTAKGWGREKTYSNLLRHDLKHESGEKCIESYTKFRDLGYTMDPLGIYRLKVFFAYPQGDWKLRDISGILTLLLTIIFLILLPSVWILPVYFVGHYWKLKTRTKDYESIWGLKMFWFVSVGYLIASLVTVIASPEILYAFTSDAFNQDEMTSEARALSVLLFSISFLLFGLVSLYKVKPGVLLSKNWTIRNSIIMGIVILFAYKIVAGIYLQIGFRNLGFVAEDLTSIPGYLLALRQDIHAFITTYGKGVSVAVICLLVPFNEEIVFRGVILDSCQRYINFKVANVIQAALFAAMHFSLVLFPVFFLFGILSGWMRKTSGGLLAGIVFHVLNNLVAILLLLTIR